MTKLEEVDRDQTCLLGVAGDVVMMLIHGLLDIEGVEKCLGEVESGKLEVCLLISVGIGLRQEAKTYGRTINGLYLRALAEK